ncbi:MAG: hypothetical protein IPG16_18005 [Comamonadaceae bacterium]|nr:hypothetical protein [Comamonadaceae bacterium]
MALPLAQAADCGAPVIEVVDAAALKGIKRVAVTSFTVQYVVRSGTPAAPPPGRRKGGAGAITSVFYTPAGVPLVLDDKFDHLAAGRFGSNVNDPMLTFAGKIKAGA